MAPLSAEEQALGESELDRTRSFGRHMDAGTITLPEYLENITYGIVLAPGERHFGGVGLMIDDPGMQLTATPAATWSAAGPFARLVLEFARRMEQSVDLDMCRRTFKPHHFVVEHAAPEHVGLGTGTQLGLATAHLLWEACGWGHTSAAAAE